MHYVRHCQPVWDCGSVLWLCIDPVPLLLYFNLLLIVRLQVWCLAIFTSVKLNAGPLTRVLHEWVLYWFIHSFLKAFRWTFLKCWFKPCWRIVSKLQSEQLYFFCFPEWSTFMCWDRRYFFIVLLHSTQVTLLLVWWTILIWNAKDDLSVAW